MKFAHRLAAAALCGIISVCAFAAEVDDVGKALEQARSKSVDVLAPEGFAAAQRAYENALKERDRGRDPARVGKHTQAAQTALERATLDAGAARQTLGGVIKTREDALAAEAPKHAPELWSRADERFTQSMAANEEGDLKSAQRRAAEAEVLLRDVELVAIKSGVLNEARAAIAQADAAKVERFAPRTLQLAKRRLADAEQEIQRSRYELALPRRLAGEAQYEAAHAMYLAQLAQRTLELEKQGQGGVESLMLSIEEPLKRLASEMEVPLRFDQPVDAPLKELAERSQQQAQEVRRLQMELEERDDRMAAVNTQLERLSARLGGVSEERIALQKQLDAQAQLRANVAKLEASLTPEEAHVERQNDDVVISLVGLNFAPGKSAITSQGAALLQKVRSGLALFPGATISVEGHTDSNGTDSANLILSQDRADAVKQHLVSNFGVDAEKITSIGYGEARPVATNETPQGRTRNRRIDLIIHPTSGR